MVKMGKSGASFALQQNAFSLSIKKETRKGFPSLLVRQLMNEILELKTVDKGDVVILKFSGRLDALTTPELEKQVYQLIDRGKHKLLLDFSSVDYISSAGMRLLLGMTKKLNKASGQMIVLSPGANVMDVFKMSGFDHVLQISLSEKDALSKF